MLDAGMADKRDGIAGITPVAISALANRLARRSASPKESEACEPIKAGLSG